MSETPLTSDELAPPVANRRPTRAVDQPKGPTAGLLQAHIPLWKSAVLAALVLVAVVASLNVPAVSKTSEPGVVMKLPGNVGDYWGVAVEPSVGERQILPPDTEFAKMNYSSIERLGENIHTGIVLAGANKASIHRPEVCLPAQGWTVMDRKTVDVKLNNGFTLPVTVLTNRTTIPLNNGESRTIETFYIYWFVGKDRSISSHWWRVIYTSLDRIFHNVNHRWAYVIVSGTPTNEDILAGRSRTTPADLKVLTDFIAKLAPTFMKPEVFSAHDAEHQGSVGK